METRARFVLIGLFTLAVIVAGFLFVYWLHSVGRLGEQAVYRIRFENSVAGLRPGSAVLFNGIRVGEVTHLRLNPENPREITATISVERNTPVRADTRITVYIQGLMGAPALALHGGDPAAPPLTAPDREPPVLVADKDAGQDVMQAAHEVLRRIDSVLADNAEPIRSTIENLNTFAAALARNADRLDSIAAGLERMVGAPETPPPAVFDLTAPREFPPIEKIPRVQLVVAEPTVILTLDTQKILAESTVGESPTFPDARWADSIPHLFQSRIVQSFENANYLRVDRPVMGLVADYQLLIDIRKFQLTISRELNAEVEFVAKLMGEDGRIADARIFRASAPAKAVSAADAAAALDEAFGKAVTELVVWTCETI